jgi:CHAT domain-containing protein
MRRILSFLVAFLLIISGQPAAQRPGSATDTSIYRVYGEQMASLLAVRGVPREEIDELLKIYKENNISSTENFASLLGKLYPADRGIGILFYFFSNDSLYRVFFEPGKIKEKEVMAVKKEDLLQLSADFNHVLGLYASSDKRMPVKRGVIIKPPPASKGLTYAGLVRKTTILLIPRSFNASYKHLVIIPPLNIGTLPFHLLSPYEDGSLLIDHCSFTIVPGIIDLIGLRVKALKTATKWRGDISQLFGENESFGEFDSTRFILEKPLFVSNPAYPQNSDFSFPDLPGAKREIANAILFAKEYKLFEGAAAVKDSVLKYLGESDVAYFATHGIADTEDPMNKSFLVLSGDDPFLTAKNIMDNRKNYKQFPEMVILSACQTGLGRSMEAGVAGLARSFLLAGSNHVIMSLWNVDDKATAYLMNRFLFHLKKPSRFMPAEPLRQALLDTRKKYPSPSQWASFSLFGIDY